VSQAGAGNPGGRSTERRDAGGQVCEEPAQITSTILTAAQAEPLAESLTDVRHV